PHLSGKLVAHEVLRAVEQLLSRLVHREPRDLFEARQRLALGVPELLLQRLDVDFAVAEALLAPFELRQARVDIELLLQDTLLDLCNLYAPVLHLALDLAPESDGLLARFDLCLAADGVGVAPRGSVERVVLGTRCAQARVRPGEQDDARAYRSDDDSDERCAGREHGTSVGGCRCRGRIRGCSHPDVDLHGRGRRYRTGLLRVV